MLRARNILTSGVGTFGVAAALCSQHVERVYCTDLYMTEHLNPTMLGADVAVYMTKLGDYIKVGEWKNTSVQRARMMTHVSGPKTNALRLTSFC